MNHASHIMSHRHLRNRDENPDLKLIYFEAIIIGRLIPTYIGIVYSVCVETP